MGPLRPCIAFVLSFVTLLSPTIAQQAPAAMQPSILLQGSLAALAPTGVPVDSILTGSARRIAGSDDEVGSVTYKAVSTGSARFDFSYPSGSRTEVRSFVDGDLAGSWSGPDGVSHEIAYHNLVNNGGIFPAFTLSTVATARDFVVAMIGLETKNGSSVYHLSVSRQFSQPSLKPLEHLSQMEIFVDTVTFLPMALEFSIHPDDNAAIDIPVELLFSDYRSVSGVKIPFHVQKFVNNSLALDLQFQSASINTGLSASLFDIQ